jgi:translation elongation factor EF-Tu-like GTPase
MMDRFQTLLSILTRVAILGHKNYVPNMIAGAAQAGAYTRPLFSST